MWWLHEGCKFQYLFIINKNIEIYLTYNVHYRNVYFFLKELQFAQRKIDLNILVNVKLILFCFQCTCYHLNYMRDLSIRLFLLSIRNQVLLRNMKSPQTLLG